MGSASADSSTTAGPPGRNANHITTWPCFASPRRIDCLLLGTGRTNARSQSELIDRLVAGRDEDEPLVEAVGDTSAEGDRLDSQVQARMIVSTVIEVLERDL